MRISLRDRVTNLVLTVLSNKDTLVVLQQGRTQLERTRIPGRGENWSMTMHFLKEKSSNSGEVEVGTSNHSQVSKHLVHVADPTLRHEHNTQRQLRIDSIFRRIDNCGVGFGTELGGWLWGWFLAQRLSSARSPALLCRRQPVFVRKQGRAEDTANSVLSALKSSYR